MSVIENLLELYQVDRQVRGLRSRVENAQTYLDAQQRQLEGLQVELEEANHRSKLTQATVANLETETASIDQRIAKLREDLKVSSTTKQYNAILEEINNLKESKGEIDDRTLAELEGIDQLKSDCDSIGEKITERTKVRDAATTDLKERTSEVSSRLSELEAERAEKASVVPGSALDLFDRAADDFEGDAMSSIVEMDRRRMEYACGCCNVSLPFNLVNTIMANRDHVQQCEGCLRILYATEELRCELVRK